MMDDLPYVWMYIEFKKDSTFREFMQLQKNLKKYDIDIQGELMIERTIYTEIMVRKEELKEVVAILNSSKNIKDFNLVRDVD